MQHWLVGSCEINPTEWPSVLWVGSDLFIIIEGLKRNMADQAADFSFFFYWSTNKKIKTKPFIIICVTKTKNLLIKMNSCTIYSYLNWTKVFFNPQADRTWEYVVKKIILYLYLHNFATQKNILMNTFLDILYNLGFNNCISSKWCAFRV